MDIEDADELARWRVVNDGVMGSRSSADANVVDSALILAGDIVTDGGGFSSVRLALDEPLGDVTGLLLRVRTDGRSDELTVADSALGRDPRISRPMKCRRSCVRRTLIADGLGTQRRPGPRSTVGFQETRRLTKGYGPD